MSLDDLKILQAKIVETKNLLNIEDLQKKADSLAEQMNTPDFWNNQENAQAISQDYQDIKKEVEKFADLEKRTKDLIELANSRDESLVDEIEQQTKKLEKEFSEYELYILLNGPYDKNNAIIAIHEI